MKKAIIAGAASAVLATMPVAASFAVGNGGNLVDTLKLNITETCTFTRDTTTPHGVGTDGAAAVAGSWGTEANADTFTKTVTHGSYADLANSSFNISCNDPDGYQVTVGTTGFTATTVTDSEHVWNYSNGGAIDTTGQSMWFLSVTGTDTDDSSTIGTNLSSNIITKRLASATPKDNNDSFKITYGAFVDSKQPAGNYTATATYTFAQLTSEGTVQSAN